MKDHYEGGFVTVMGGPPCVIVETWGDEALIKAIAGGFSHEAGQEWVVAKKDLMPAQVFFAEAPREVVKPAEPDWNKIIGREREYSK